MGQPRKGPGNRAKLTNGTRVFLGGGDMRSERGRRFADILDGLLAERGGAEALSMTQREAARTFAGLALIRDDMHARLAKGEPVNVEELGQIGDRMTRQVRLMGPVRQQKALGIREHIAARRGEKTRP